MIPWKRYVSPAVGVLIALTVVTTLVAAVNARSGGHLYGQLALIPARVWQGEVWRLVTWTLVERGPSALLFGCITLYWFGGDLAARWGQQRFVAFVVTIVLAASVGTSLVALVMPSIGRYPHFGGWALGDALMIAWALQFPERRIRIYHVLVVGGPLLAYGAFGFVLLCAVFYGFAPMLPVVIAASAALLHMTDSLPRRRSRPHGEGGRERGPYATV